jgi:hypothetical protein
MSKDTDECKFCDARAAYVMGVDAHKFTDRPARGSIIRYPGDEDMSKGSEARNIEDKETEAEEFKKTCTGPCGETLPLSKFGRAKSGKYGRKAICKSCEAEKAKKKYWEKKAKAAGAKDPDPEPQPPKPKTTPFIIPKPFDKDLGYSATDNHPPAPAQAVEPVKDPVKPAETRFNPRFKMRPRPGIDVPDDPDVLVLDFSRHPDLLEWLKITAKEDFRTPEAQAMWMLSMDRKDPVFSNETITPWAKEEQEKQEA